LWAALFWPSLCHFGCEECPPGVAGVGGLMMRKWLAYWQVVAVWIVLSFLAALIYLFPVARVVEALVD
jgi:hypothetical protein